jgi:hypothetical protein
MKTESFRVNTGKQFKRFYVRNQAGHKIVTKPFGCDS